MQNYNDLFAPIARMVTMTLVLFTTVINILGKFSDEQTILVIVMGCFVLLIINDK